VTTMPYKDININAKTINRLKTLSKNGRFSHAYIFSGNADTEVEEAAREFIKAAHCSSEGEKPCGKCLSCKKIDHDNHEDVIYIRRDENSIKVKQIEELQTKLKNKPFAADRIAAIITDADKMTPESQNKLLKTLEEPAPGYIIILISENPERLVKTILSRCVLVRIEADRTTYENPMAEYADALIEMLLTGSPYHVITKLLDEAILDKDAAIAILDALETGFHRQLIICLETPGKGAIATTIPDIIDMIEEARRDLNYNISNKYTMRNLVLGAIEALSKSH
jgi:DNA polymerase-3 subunit delta'